MTTRSLGPGTVLGGRYRLDDLLSEDGLARFYRGTDIVLSRSVAINALPSSDPRATGLLDAARRSALVIDPHLLRVLDCEDQDGITWVVNEWGSGSSLDIMLAHDTLPPARAAWLAREVAGTLANAHARGVTHGRLTPECVMVTHDGSVKLIGFVIAAAIEGGADTRSSPYGEVDDREADVIDLAGILYAALVGKWPGVSPSRVPEAPRDPRGPLRPRQVRAGVPRLLDTICERVLRREAHEHRLPIETAHEIEAALSDFVGEAAAGTPLDVPSMYVAPEDNTHASLLDETQAAAMVDWSLPVHEEPPPLPPFEDDPERPLFAETSRRPSPAKASVPGAPHFPPPTDTGEWIFDAAPKDEGADAHRWLKVAAAVAALAALIVAMVLAFHLGSSSSPTPSSDSTSTATPTAVGKPIKPVAISDFDPEGSPASENPQDAPLAIDGDDSTGWGTMTYRGNSRLGGLKTGVGLLLDLGTDRKVATVALKLTGAPTSISILMSPRGVDVTPTTAQGLNRVAGVRTQGTTTQIRLASPATGRYLVVWLTDLPKSGSGYRGQIDEITVLG